MHSETEIIRIRLNHEESTGEALLASDLQRSYLAGMGEEMSLGGHQSHALFEYRMMLTDTEKIKEIFTKLILRHEILRCCWDAESQPVRAEETALDIRIHNLPETLYDETDAADCLRESMFQEEIDIHKAPLLRCEVVRLKDCQILLFHISELICDGFSHEIFRRDIDTMLRGIDPAPLSCGYQDYLKTVAEMREWGFLDEDKSYWEERITENWQAPAFHFKKQPELISISETAQLSRHMNAEVLHQLEALAEQNGITLFALLLTVYAKVIERYSRVKDFVMIVPRTARAVGCENVNEIAGVCSDFFVYENQKWSQGTLLDEIRSCTAQINSAISHTFVTGTEILQMYRRKTGRSLPVNISFTATLGSETASEERISCSKVRMHTSQLMLETCLVPMHGGAEICLAYVPDALEELARGGYSLHSADAFALSASDRAVIDSMNRPETDMPDDTAFRKNFLETIRCGGDRTAIASSKERITYRRLLHDIGRMQAFFTEKGLQEGDVIAIQLPKCTLQTELTTASVIGGFVYMPLEYELPPESTAVCLKQSGSAVLITDKPAPSAGIPVLDAEELLNFIKSDAESPVRLASDAQNKPLIIINTSGTTGVPKSSVLMTYSISDCIYRTQKRFGIGSGDTSLAVTNFAHDMAIFDSLFMLCYGGCTVIPDDRLAKEPSHWIALMRQYHVTVWESVPAFHEMCTAELLNSGTSVPPLRVIISGGDFLPMRLVKHLWSLHPGCTIYNVGGPSETTVWNISHRITQEDVTAGSIPYGIPFEGTGYLLLDENGAECPVGSEGVMYIYGISLSAGYAGAEKLNHEKFTEYQGKRIYNTGDRGIRRADGELLLLGRTDRQIKRNGKTISLTGIGTVLRSCKGVSDAVADFDSDTKRIIAFVVAEQEERTALERELSLHLPPYQIPQVFLYIERIPLTRNGKPDLKAIRKIYDAWKETQETAQPETDAVITDSVLNFIMQTLRGLFGREDIAQDVNYFALGGDSIMAVRLASVLRAEYGIELRLFDLLERPYPAEWAKLIHEALAVRNSGDMQTIPEEICRIVESKTGVKLTKEQLEQSIFRITKEISVMRSVAQELSKSAGVEFTVYDIISSPYLIDWCEEIERRHGDA